MRYRVVLLEEGQAASGRTYTREALLDVLALASGLRCYADHAIAPGARSVRDLVGTFTAPEYVPAGLAPGGLACVEATLSLVGPSAAYVADIADACLAGTGAIAGLSIDAMAEVGPGNVVRRIPALASVDVVSKAGAGGRFLRQIGAPADVRQRRAPEVPAPTPAPPGQGEPE